MVFLSAAMHAEGEDRAKLISTAEGVFEHLRVTSPNSEWVPLVGQVYAQTVGGNRAALIKGPEVRCSPEAVAAYNSAEERFARREFTQAKPFYERAVNLCPENPLYKVMYGDAFFMLGDIPTARVQYNLALAADPNDWTALRFRADSYLKEGDYTRARTDAIASVAANVTYGFGWNYLRGVQQQTGGGFHYVEVLKPALPVGADPNKPTLVVSDLGTMNYQLARMTVERLRPSESAPVGPLDLEREAVRLTIQTLVARDPNLLLAPEHTIWRLFAEADAAGYLDEAIFVLWLDESLVPAYLAHRDAHRDRIEEYISLYLAPAPAAP